MKFKFLLIFLLNPAILLGQRITYKFDLEKELNKPSTSIKLSTLVKSVRYVKLETRDNVIVGDNNTQTLSIGEHIFVSQGDQPLQIFNDQGIFIRSIGQFGRGPNEYGQNYSYTVDYADRQIYILKKNTVKIFCFGFDGIPVKTIELDYSIIQFSLIDKNIFCACIKKDDSKYKDRFNYVIFNDKGMVLKKLYIPGNAYREFKTSGNALPITTLLTPTFSNSPAGLNILTQQNDTIFSIARNGDIYPGLIFNFGKYNPPFFPMDPTIDQSEKNKYVRSFGAVETLSDWFIGFSLNKQFYKYKINKSTNSVIRIDNITNDIDGGLGFWPFYLSDKGKSFAFPYLPYILKKALAEKRFNRTDLLYPTKQIELFNLINTLDISDNPIVVIFDLL